MLAHVYWYDHRWSRVIGDTPSLDEMKRYHSNEPPIIDVASYDE